MKLYINIVTLLLLACCSFVVASAEITPQSEALIQNLEEQIKSTIAAITDAESKAGNNVQELHILIDLPAKNSSNFGLILDLDSQDNGYKVLSVTPGSVAETLDIKQGDLVTSINDIDINSSQKRKAFSTLEAITPGDNVKLQLTRNGKQSTIETELKGQYFPPFKLEIGSVKTVDFEPSLVAGDKVPDNSNACGSVSVFFSPPETKRLYDAFINKIDNRQVMRGRDTFRLKPGKHIIHLHELINHPFFKRISNSFQKSKPIEIEVKQNTTYYLAAKHISGKFYSYHKGNYWEPVVWKISENRSCEL